MTFINTDGLSFLGPGSEWFWTAFQGIVVALSLWGLLRQVRIQTAQKMREDMTDLAGQWQSERMLRYRVRIVVAQRDGVVLPQEGAAPRSIAFFWEEMAGLTRRGHLDKDLMLEALGADACWAWQALQPWVHRMRETLDSEEYFADWEWLVHEAVRLHPAMALALAGPIDPDGWVARLQDMIDVEVQLRH